MLLITYVPAPLSYSIFTLLSWHLTHFKNIRLLKKHKSNNLTITQET